MAMADDWRGVTGETCADALTDSWLDDGTYGDDSDDVTAGRVATTLRVATAMMRW
jgi:hypothetical protein